MKLDRTNNALRNIFFGLANKIVTLFFPFITRALIIHKIGAEYLGLSSLFSSILDILNISELGFSSAVVFSMYQLIADDDQEALCAMLNFFRKVYHVVGIIILLMGISIMPFLRYFIKTGCPEDINLYILYALYLCNAVIGYLLFAYKNALLTAFQREDVISNINTVVKFLLFILQVLILLVTKNYYLFVVAMIFSTCCINILAWFVTKKMFPQIQAFGNISSDQKSVLIQKVKGIVIIKITSATRNSFDSVFISSFLGLRLTAIYNNYYLIMQAVIAFSAILMNSISAGIGNSIATESEEKNFSDLTKMNFIYMWLVGFASTCMLVLYQPFTVCFYGNDMLLPFSSMLLFVLYFYLLKMSDLIATYKWAKGLFWEARFPAICETLLNIVLNYTLGKYFGIIGILTATLISIFLCDFIWSTTVPFRYYFKKEWLKDYFIKHLLYLLLNCVFATIIFFICYCIRLPLMAEIIVRLIICCVVFNLFYIICYKKTNIYQTSISWIMKIFHLDRIAFAKILL